MTVTIRSGSWHYRVWKWAQDPFVLFDRWDPPDAKQLERRAKEPAAICGYFWTIVLTPPAFLFFALVVGGIAAVIGAVVGIVWLIIWPFRYVKRHWSRKPLVEKPPSFVSSFVAAKKARICPRIEVEQDTP